MRNIIIPLRHRHIEAFTLTELLAVVGVVALLVALSLPALCHTRTSVHLVQCMSNCRQIGEAAQLYRFDNNDTYPYGQRVSYGYQALDPKGWPMQLLRYMGGYETNVQPRVFLCPNEQGVATNWPFQLHYQGNRAWFSDVDFKEQPTRGSVVPNLAKYWIAMDKGPYDFGTIKPGILGTYVLAIWNSVPGLPQYRRHDGGLVAAAADGHVEWIRTPPYQPGAPRPENFLELGDCSNGDNPYDITGPDAKLFARYSTSIP